MSTGTIIMDHEVSETIDQATNDQLAELTVQEALDFLWGWLAYERSKREEWFEVDDKDLYAYHRSYERGLERGIAALEAAHKAASVERK